ncbi:hypothetical protein FRC03_003846, partial [Tulasnella sp. 419]
MSNFDMSGIKQFDVTDKLTFDKRVGCGAHSDVYTGWLDTNEGKVKVAVKELRIPSHLQEERFQK